MKILFALIPTILSALLAIYIYFIRKRIPEVYAPAKQDEIIIQYPKWIFYFSSILLCLGAVFFFLVILVPNIFGDSVFTVTFLAVFFYIGGFFALLDFFISRLRLLGQHIVYTTPFGTKKEFDFSDILYVRLRINPNESRGVAYGKNYKKLFNFSSMLVNTHLLVEAFEQNNIPLEYQKRKAR